MQQCHAVDRAGNIYIAGMATGIVQINFPVTNSGSFYLVVNDTKWSDPFSIFLTR